MDMEERIYTHPGGARVQQLSDVELNDMEHPKFVNSSLSDDEDLRENNNSYSDPGPGKKFPSLINSVVVPPKIRQPPVSSSSSCFVASVMRLMQENNNSPKTTQDATASLQSLQKTISKETFEGQREVLENFQRSNEKRSELMKLKERINQLQIQKKTLGEDYTRLVTSCAKRQSASKAKLAKVQETYKMGEARLNNKKEVRAKRKEQLKHAKRKLEDVSREDDELTKWTQEHNITVHMQPKRSNNSSEKDEVVIELLNVNPLKPEDRFHILAESVTLDRFSIGNVFPVFEESFDVIERANESQDLIQLLRDCMRFWKRDCEMSSRNSEQTVLPDQTVELFGSPNPPVSN